LKIADQVKDRHRLVWDGSCPKTGVSGHVTKVYKFLNRIVKQPLYQWRRQAWARG